MALKTLTKLLLLAFLVGWTTGCSKDEITETKTSSNNTNGSGGSSDIDGEDDDYIDNSTFDLTVKVVFSASGDATVSGTTDSVKALISGNGVTITNAGSSKVQYELSGTTSNGYFKLYSGKKQAIVLNSVSLTNPSGAAINIQGPTSKPSGGKRTFVVVNGTNRLADGTTYSNTPSTEDEKGVLFSEGKLAISGTGSLTISAQGKSGIVSDDYVRFLASPTITVTSSASHGIKANDGIIIDAGTLDVTVSTDMKKGLTSDDYVTITGGTTTIKVTGSAAYDSDDQEYTGTAGIKADSTFTISGGTLTITNSGKGGKGISGDGIGYFNGGTVSVTVTGTNYGNSSSGFGPSQSSSSDNSVAAKAIKFDGNLYFNGSTVTAKAASHEAIESKGTITISSGVVYAYSSDDAINSSSDFTISGGTVCGYSSGNDGMDANGNFYVKGGLVYAIGASSPEVAIDANTESGYKLYLSGGTLIAIGGLENGSSLSQNCYSASSWTRNTNYALNVGSSTYAFKTPSSGGSGLVVSGASTPTLTSGASISGGTEYCEGMLTVNPSVSGGSNVSLSSYSGGNSGGGPGGGPGGNGPRGR